MDLSAYVLGNRGSISLTMGSFKLRLVIYFMLLALLPLVAATVAFSEVAERGETNATDSRLTTAIRVADLCEEQHLRERIERVLVDRNKLFKALYDAPPLEWRPGTIRNTCRTTGGRPTPGPRSRPARR